MRTQLDRLIQALLSIGYAFDVKTKSEAPDWPLEIRLFNAINYAKSKTRKKSANPLAVFDHPALAWVREEKIALPSRFAPHPQAAGMVQVSPDIAADLDRLEKRTGPVPDSLKEWFRTCGAVDLRGRHPFLNPKGQLEALHLRPLALCIDEIENGWMPLSDTWKVRVTDATLADGRTFSEAVQDAFHWAGVPGIAALGAKPERELAYVRAKLEAA
jgi:hypothetical protein